MIRVPRSLPSAPAGWRQQSGIALVIALVFLLVLTILGVTAMQTSTLQERMSGNVRDRNLAFQFAEEALRDAEWRLQNQDLSDQALDIAELHEPEDVPYWGDVLDCDSGDVASVIIDGFDGADLAYAEPCYFIEDLSAGVDGGLPPGDTTGDVQDDPSQRLFRVTAIGFGATPDSRVVLRSTTSGMGTGADNGNGNGGNGNGAGGG